MKNKGVWIGALVIIAAVVVGVVLLQKNGNDETNTNSNSNNASSSSADGQSADNSDSSAMSNAVETTSVDIKDYEFTPAVIKVKVGQTVTWTNQDTVQHDVVANDPSPDAPAGPLLSKGESYKFTFKKAGTYTLHCSPHPYMHQVVQVTE